MNEEMGSTIDPSVADTLTGYAHPTYADSLAEFGVPRELSQCKGWILQRKVPGFPYHDGMGSYPLFACQNWSRLYTDLENIGNRLVSLALVADPFGEYDVTYLRRCFGKVLPFKEHFVTHLVYPVNDVVSAHHRYYARKALRELLIEECPEPTQLIDEWATLYAALIKRHNIAGIRAFSRESFAKQMSVPGIVAFRAMYQGATVGAHLWYVQGRVGYSHLEAVSPIGYRKRAAYALYWFALNWFHQHRVVRWLNLGAGAGIGSKGADGLSQFKQGWSTGTRPAYFCGRIFDHERYSEIVEAKGVSVTDYFPAYREGEFD
jgi:hypothetical protein